MLFFASGQGRLTVVPAQINQNSNGANTIYLTGAFPSASVVTVAFTLPDGTNTEPQLMTGDKTVDYNGLTLAVKEYSLPKSITQVYGRVTAQFYIQNGSEILATEATNITVAKGVPSESTSAPENIYEQIVAALSSIQTELTNKLDKQSGSTAYDMVYAKSESGAQKMKPSSPYIMPSHIVERDDEMSIHVPYATLPEHAVPLQQFTERLAEAIAKAIAKIAADIATKLDIAGGTITGDLDVDGDLVVSGDFTAKGKTFIEEATTLAVKNAIIETNAGKTDLKTLLSGLVINKNPTTAYGFVYDPTDDTVKFGQGSVDENGVFTFKTGEGSPVATRSDSSTFTAEHLVKWDNVKKRFVDAGKSISEVGQTPKSIDAVNGAFTSVTYDTTDGITLVSIAKIINTDDSEYTATFSQEIPIVGGKGISIDKQANAEKVEVKANIAEAVKHDRYTSSVVIGENATVASTNSVAIGTNAISNYESVAVGDGAKNYHHGGTAVGSNAITGWYSTAIGTNTYASSDDGRCVAIGYYVKAIRNDNIVLGSYNEDLTSEDRFVLADGNGLSYKHNYFKITKDSSAVYHMFLNGAEVPTQIKTLFGNQSIVGTGNIDLYQHHILCSTPNVGIKVLITVISSKNLKVDSLTDLKTLLGNTFECPCTGYAMAQGKSLVICNENGFLPIDVWVNVVDPTPDVTWSNIESIVDTVTTI